MWGGGVVTYIAQPNDLLYVEGEIHGKFKWPPTGNNGFGYDPIFFYPLLGKTFGEIDPFLKHSISHRYLAFNKLKNKIQKVVDA